MKKTTHAPILWRDHEAKKKCTKGFNCYQNHRYVDHCNILEMGTRDYPERFILRARLEANGERYATEGFFPTLKAARDFVQEFAKALTFTLPLLALMLGGPGL
jgi:hypothetical protein